MINKQSGITLIPTIRLELGYIPFWEIQIKWLKWYITFRINRKRMKRRNE